MDFKTRMRDLIEKGVAGTKDLLLGTAVYDLLANQKKPAVHPEDPEVKSILDGIEALKKRIEAKEMELSEVRKKGG